MAILVVMIALSYYGKQTNPDIILSDCLADPERYHGSIISVGTEATVAEIFPDGFLLRQMGRLVPVYGDVGNISKNEFVNLVARFHKEGYLELLQIYEAKYRRLKIAASILPVIVILFMFFKSFRYERRGIQFVERK